MKSKILKQIQFLRLVKKCLGIKCQSNWNQSSWISLEAEEYRCKKKKLKWNLYSLLALQMRHRMCVQMKHHQSIYHTHTSKWSIHFNWWIMIDCGFLAEQIHFIRSHDNDWQKQDTKKAETKQNKSESTINERSNECTDSYTCCTVHTSQIGAIVERFTPIWIHHCLWRHFLSTFKTINQPIKSIISQRRIFITHIVVNVRKYTPPLWYDGLYDVFARKPKNYQVE